MATKKIKETEIVIDNEKKYGRFIEEAKFISDYLKHIATLDTGSIVLMATFLQKNTQPVLGRLISLAAVFLLISLISVVITQHFLTITISHSTEDVKNTPTSYQKLAYRTITVLALISFIIGLSILGLFVVYSVFKF